MILHDRTEAAQIFVLCRVHLRACFVHSLLSIAAIESLEQGNVSEMHTTILTCSRGIYNVTSVRVQGNVGALARQNTYSNWAPCDIDVQYSISTTVLSPFSRSCSAFWGRRVVSWT
jgi:hypothetical protein